MMVQCYVVYAFSRPISWELGGGGVWGYSRKTLVGVCGPFPQNPYPTKNL